MLSKTLTGPLAFIVTLSSSSSSQYSLRGDVGELGRLFGCPSILLPPLLKPSRFFAFRFCTMFHSRSRGADISKQELNKSPELYVVTAGLGPRIFLTPFSCDSALNGFALGSPPWSVLARSLYCGSFSNIVSATFRSVWFE